MRTLILLGLAVLPALAEGESPYPKGTSTQKHDGMEFTLVLPSDYDAAKEYALLIALHGMNGKASNVAGAFTELTRDGFVVCAPQCARAGWDQPNVNRAKGVLSHLIEVLAIDAKRLHGAAFSQGCGSLASVVFDRKFHFVSASWSMGGSTGGKVPPRAKKEMGVIALVGSEDWARGAAEGTVKQLRKKVRTVECHVQQGLGHEFPSKLAPYHRYWLTVMNGGFEPGECGFFEWSDDVEAAKLRMAAEKRGGLLYFFSKKDGESVEARRVQNGVLFDPIVRHYGRRAVAVKLAREGNEELFKQLGLTATPAVVVTKPDFEPAKSFEGAKVKAAALAKELRKVVRDKAPPKKPGVFLHE